MAVELCYGRRFRALALACALATLAGCRKDRDPAGPGGGSSEFPIVSTFDSDLEGWSAFNDGHLSWAPTGGNPGGWARGDDLLRAQAWFFSAPNRYLGNVSGAYGRWLTFDLHWTQAEPGGPTAETDGVVLVGDRLTLVAVYPQEPTSMWMTFRFRLDETGGWVNKQTGAAATRAEIQEVLGGLRALRIRGEFRDNAEQAGLDNVRFGAES